MRTTIYNIVIIIVIGIAFAYIVTNVNCRIKFSEPQVQVPEYNDYKPAFRVVSNGNRYYVEYKTYDSKGWRKCDVPLPTEKDAQAVVDKSRQKCRENYSEIVGEESQDPVL